MIPLLLNNWTEPGVLKFLMVRPDGSDSTYLGTLADKGRLRPAIGGASPLVLAREAYELSEAGRVRGKIVLEV
jgi:NADPH:quinone reductase-like Zn-dependent oxidoreductase